MIFITFLLGGKKPPGNFRARRFPSKLKGAWKKPTTPAQLFWSPSYQKYSIFLILTWMSDVFGLDSHERIGHSWIILCLNHSKYYFCQESTTFDRPKAPIAHRKRFESAVFQNERWLSGWFRGKSHAIKLQSGTVWSPFQVYKIIMIPHKQQAETDSRVPQ
jgi:hypothetical protein